MSRRRGRWDADGNGGVFTDPASEARMEVVREVPAQYIGTFLSASCEALSENEDWLLRRFYTGDLLSGAWAVTCQAPEETWEDQEKLLTALARTFTAGEARPFDGLYPVASEPSWQTVDGDRGPLAGQGRIPGRGRRGGICGGGDAGLAQ